MRRIPFSAMVMLYSGTLTSEHRPHRSSLPEKPIVQTSGSDLRTVLVPPGPYSGWLGSATIKSDAPAGFQTGYPRAGKIERIIADRSLGGLLDSDPNLQRRP